ncbi:MAG TPA: glycosyltransferase family 39 protein [Puia sp.]|jgi:4-amino-4-deoxy-L-arabinose transferase-like glycosyltransferase
MIDPHVSPWEAWLKKWFIGLLIPAILVNAGGLFVTILEPDGALYATIARTIARTGDFIDLRVEGKDWLDKPHFPFWMAALSFRVFGIHGFAYKLPALLFWGAGAWYTWKLALALYGRPVAQISTLIYVSAAHLVISNNDVRAEPYLTGLIIGSVYHFYRASRIRPGSRAFLSGQGLHLVAGSLLAACAVMTKGPFVMITISAGFILDWIAGKEGSVFRDLRSGWIAIRSLTVAVLLTALFTLPELYCLYVQFDLHPEKIVFGHTGVSGIRFFFWDSQFGRFFNTGPIKGSGDPLFYFHTLLWAFLPWSLLLYAAVVQKCRGLLRTPAGKAGPQHTPAVTGDNIPLGATLVSFALFSMSRFQLPHYLNILFPFFSILTAGYLYGIRRRLTQKIIRIAQGIINILLPTLLLFFTWWYHFNAWVLLATGVVLLSLLSFWLFRGRELPASIGRSYCLSLIACAFVNFCLYPAVLQYQAGTQAGRVAPSPIYMPAEGPVNYSFEFYCPRPVIRVSSDSLSALLDKGPVYIFSPSSWADTFKRKGFRVASLRRFPNFHVSQLTGEFIDYRTRDSTLEWYSILWVGRQPGPGR